MNTRIMILLMIVIGGSGYLCFTNNGFNGINGFGRIWSSEQTQYISYFENSLPEWKYFTTQKIPEKLRTECDFYDLHKYRLKHATRIPVPKIDYSCFERNTAYSKSVFIWGNSHAQMLYFGLNNYLPKNWQILQVASSGCSPNPNVTEPSTTDFCDHSNWFAIKKISETKPDVVIVAQNLGQTLGTFEKIAAKLKGLGVKKVIFTGPSPHWTTDLPKIIVRRLWENTPRRTYVGIDTKVIETNRNLKLNFKDSEFQKFVSIIDLFCNKQGCLTYIGDNKKTGVTSWDYGHLSPIASNYLAKNLLVNVITAGTSQLK